MRLTLLAALALSVSVPALAAETIDRDMINRITDAGMNQSEVLDTATWISDRIGGRMTNSPQMRVAEKWAQSRFKAWGLTNVHPEGFDFGRGWSIDSLSVRMTVPRLLTLRAIPVAWTPATAGAISAPVIVAPLRRDRDFDKWRGKLAGKIVMVTLPDTGSEPDKSVFSRYTDEDLRKLDKYDQPNNDDAAAERRLERRGFAARLDAFLVAEGAKAWVKMSRSDGGLLHGEGSGYRVGETPKLPGIEMSAEDYRRLARLAKTDAAPALEIDSRVRFHDDDHNAYNIIADIAGRDPKAGYVMAGAHLDSWVAGDGATDNAAGSAVVMEAARILASLPVKPKRTIRFALWSGEEEGILGSLAYVDQHLASRPPETDPARIRLGAGSNGWSRRFPVTPRADYGQLGAYFNLDNGSGKIRGIYAEDNAAAVPIFKEWLAPFAGMGATTVASGRTGSTDHVYLQSVGLPAYQFIQDPLDYSNRTHHTDVDTADHLKAADLRQAAVIMASFLWNAANRDAPLPRMPLPTKPRDSNPYAYPDEDD